MEGERETLLSLPEVPKVRPRRFGRLVARFLCVLLAIVGLLPVLGLGLVRSPWARDWATQRTAELVNQQGFSAHFELAVQIWPLALRVSNVRLDSKDGSAPALLAQRVTARPRLFALLGGKLVIDEIEIEKPEIHVEIAGNTIKNLGIELPKSDPNAPEAPWKAPISVVSVTDAKLDVIVDGIHAKAREVDLDLTVDSETGTASDAFEIAARIGEAKVQRYRVLGEKNGKLDVAADDDLLCGVEARVRLEQKLFTIRRVHAKGAFDVDPAEDTWGHCDLPREDKRVVELGLNHLKIRPVKDGIPEIDGHIALRLPIAVVQRFVDAPDNDGWVSIDADLATKPGHLLPQGSGRIEAEGVRLLKFRFAQQLRSDFEIVGDVVRSPKTTVRVGDGTVSLYDVEVKPLAKEVPIYARLDIQGLDFTQLMRDLGVAEHPHVQWDVNELTSARIGGTIVPLAIDGDIQSKSQNFAVYTKATDDAARTRIIGIKEASFTSHVSIRPLALEFSQLQLKTPRGFVENAFVHIGFHEDLRVDVPKMKLDLDDISPLVDIKLVGVVEGSATVDGQFGDPRVHADTSIENFQLAEIPFGNIDHAHTEFQGETVDLSELRATKRTSNYEAPSVRLDFSGPASVRVDGLAKSENLKLKDFLAIFHMEDDPAYADIDAEIGMRSEFRVTLGGPEDPCGGGRVDVSSSAHLKKVKLTTENFGDAHVDFELHWIDRLAGLRGAELDVRGITLHKIHEPGQAPIGWVLGQAQIHRGGELRANIVAESMPLSRIDSLGKLRSYVDGTASVVAKLEGNIDTFTARTDVDLSPLRIRGAQFGPSHVRITTTQRPARPPRQELLSGCKMRYPDYTAANGLPEPPDPNLSTGDHVLSGDLFDGAIGLDAVTISRQKSADVTGAVHLKKLDLGLVAKAALPPPAEDEDLGPALGGELSGDLKIDRMHLDDLPRARATFTPTKLLLSRGDQSVAMRPVTRPFVFDSDTLTLPDLVLDLKAAAGLRGALSVHGSIGNVTHDPTLDLAAEIAPIDLGFLVGTVPRLARAQGIIAGAVVVRGPAKDPDVTGNVNVRNGEFAIQGVPGVLTEVAVDVRATASEVELVRATGKYAGGDISATGRVSIHGASLGLAESQIVLRDIHLAPVDGIDATVDADLRVTLNTQAQSGAASRLPHIGGDVMITAFDYTRPTKIVPDIGGFKVGAKRTTVETYDPSLDKVTFGPDLTIRSRVPLKIRNNLVDVSLSMDGHGIQVSGTNQRIGLRGELRTLPGGRFRLFANDFDVQRAVVRFDDPTRIAPNVDALAVTEYRRYTNTSVTGASGAGAGTSAGAAAAGGGAGGRGGGLWRISLHAYGDAENLKLDMTSDPALSQEDIFLLLTIGLTRAEVDQVQAGSVYASAAFEAIGTASGADRALREAIPVIDDFRFGSAYSSRTGRSEPQVTVGRRLTENVRASVTTGLTEDRQLRSNVEWRLNRRVSVQTSYDNINTISSSAIGNVGLDLRWRLEFE